MYLLNLLPSFPFHSSSFVILLSSFCLLLLFFSLTPSQKRRTRVPMGVGGRGGSSRNW
jgi:hypothetical protein